VDSIFGVFALPLFLSGAIANAGTERGMDGPHRVPWAFRVELKRERIISFKRLEHIGPQEINTHSAKWLAAMAAIDAEIAQIPQTKGLNGKFSDQAYQASWNVAAP